MCRHALHPKVRHPAKSERSSLPGSGQASGGAAVLIGSKKSDLGTSSVTEIQEPDVAADGQLFFASQQFLAAAGGTPHVVCEGRVCARGCWKNWNIILVGSFIMSSLRPRAMKLATMGQQVVSCCRFQFALSISGLSLQTNLPTKACPCEVSDWQTRKIPSASVQ
mmetsp:Transcript_105846/g.188258  ORF Transcript_105846/g.188258 Transcript_105846/m.188258 type:complete len:165 (+) Transcript_105846:567-1061(+)